MLQPTSSSIFSSVMAFSRGDPTSLPFRFQERGLLLDLDPEERPEISLEARPEQENKPVISEQKIKEIFNKKASGIPLSKSSWGNNKKKS